MSTNGRIPPATLEEAAQLIADYNRIPHEVLNALDPDISAALRAGVAAARRLLAGETP